MNKKIILHKDSKLEVGKFFYKIIISEKPYFNCRIVDIKNNAYLFSYDGSIHGVIGLIEESLFIE